MTTEEEVKFMMTIHTNFKASMPSNSTGLQTAFVNMVKEMVSTRQISAATQDILGRIYNYPAIKAPAEIQYQYRSKSERC